jgi:hypothetical protein
MRWSKEKWLHKNDKEAVLFLKKKNQKNFCSWGFGGSKARAFRPKVFCGPGWASHLFFKKTTAFLRPDCPQIGDPHEPTAIAAV